MARLKALDVARTVWPENPGAVVLGADTIVVQGDDVLGKPADQAQALDMLTRLCGAEHMVVTGCCLAARGREEIRFHAETRVRMRAATRDELAAYVATGEPADKAGAYAIQGLAACLVEWVEGSYTNVVGLPLAAGVGGVAGLGRCGPQKKTRKGGRVNTDMSCFNCGEPGELFFGYPICDTCKSKLGLFTDKTIKSHILKYATDNKKQHSYEEEIACRMIFLDKDYIKKENQASLHHEQTATSGSELKMDTPLVKPDSPTQLPANGMAKLMTTDS